MELHGPVASRSTPPHTSLRGGELPPIVLGFLEHLRRLPLGTWADAARQADDELLGPAPAAASGAEMRARLRQIMDEAPGVAMQTSRRVRDLAAVASGFVHHADVARMKKAALAAALALVARPALGEEDFARLYGPFADVVPLHELTDTPSLGLARETVADSDARD
ncbi:MAG TPA: hypothetical protein VFS08_15915 [Gemmatimonadaceae bacterium]|nr:hypothetical protein [Gemmatimonadaceae bacterium]